MNDDCKAVYFENIYQVVKVNPYDKDILNVDFDVSLNISIEDGMILMKLKKSITSNIQLVVLRS